MVNTQPAGDMDIIQMLREDYQLKASYLTAHFSRLWTRFSFLLSIQLALFGAVGYLLYEKPLGADATSLPIGLGLATAVLWFFVGVQDRYLVEEYRDGLIQAFKLLRTKGGMEQHWSMRDCVGYHQGQDRGFHRRGWLSWYVKPVSITLLPAWIPLLTALLWIAALVLQRAGLLWFKRGG